MKITKKEYEKTLALIEDYEFDMNYHNKEILKLVQQLSMEKKSYNRARSKLAEAKRIIESYEEVEKCK